MGYDSYETRSTRAYSVEKHRACRWVQSGSVHQPMSDVCDWHWGLDGGREGFSPCCLLRGAGLLPGCLCRHINMAALSQGGFSLSPTSGDASLPALHLGPIEVFIEMRKTSNHFCVAFFFTQFIFKFLLSFLVSRIGSANGQSHNVLEWNSPTPFDQVKQQSGKILSKTKNTSMCVAVTRVWHVLEYYRTRDGGPVDIKEEMELRVYTLWKQICYLEPKICLCLSP